MNRAVARKLHESTNLAFWAENPDWDSGNAAANIVCRGLQALPFSVHQAQKRAFYDTSRLIAVNGESVVVANGDHKVDKFMFRYPGKMPLKHFWFHASLEVRAVTSSLTGVALPTTVDIKRAQIFRNPRAAVMAVAQTQEKLDLNVHPPLNLDSLTANAQISQNDRTAQDLELMLAGIDTLTDRYNLYPDVAPSSGNIRRNIFDGSVNLIDVMPIYSDGSRLIGDKPPGLVEHTLKNIQNYQEFVGQYGA